MASVTRDYFKPAPLWIAAAAITVVAAAWTTGSVTPDQLVRSVNRVAEFEWLESRSLYLVLMLASVSFPFLFSFHPRIGFSRHWRYFFRANLAVAAVFILWDMYFTRIGVWGFNQSYVLHEYYIWNLPLEECLFFILIPYACLFIYASLPNVISTWRIPGWISIGLALAFFSLAVLRFDRMYTVTTALLSAFSLLYFWLYRPEFKWGRFYLAYFISCIPFVLVNGVLTGAFTLEPVVMYNPDEYFGVRLVSIPLDDFLYSFLMLLWNIGLFEKFKSAKT